MTYWLIKIPAPLIILLNGKKVLNTIMNYYIFSNNAWNCVLFIYTINAKIVHWFIFKLWQCSTTFTGHPKVTSKLFNMNYPHCMFQPHFVVTKPEYLLLCVTELGFLSLDKVVSNANRTAMVLPQFASLWSLVYLYRWDWNTQN